LERDKGLRDVLVNRGGIIQVGWMKPEGASIEPRTALYGGGIVEQDVFGHFVKSPAGWFSLLDEVYRHFVPRLIDAGIPQGMSADDLEGTRFFRRA